MSSYAEAKTCVLWDVEECPIPSGLDPESVAKNIKSALAEKGYRGEVTIWAYGEKYQVQDYYESAGIKVFPQGGKYARAAKMRSDVIGWVLGNRGGLTNLMVILGDDMYFESFLKTCKMANHNILLAQPEDAPRGCDDCRMPLESLITYEWIWESLSAGGDSITTTASCLQSDIVM